MSRYTYRSPARFAVAMATLDALRRDIPPYGWRDHEIRSRPNDGTGLIYGSLILRVSQAGEADAIARAVSVALELRADVDVRPDYLAGGETQIEITVTREIEPGSEAQSRVSRQHAARMDAILGAGGAA